MITIPHHAVNVAVHLTEPLLALGVRAALAGVPGIRLCGAEQPADSRLHVLITDWEHGVRFLGAERDIFGRQSCVLILASQPREQALVAALRGGLRGLLLSSCSAEELLAAIDALAGGRSYICPMLAQRMAESLSREPLTAREEEVLTLLARGLCNKRIAGHLGIATGTVKGHVKAIFGKLQACTRTEAASIATELGLIGLPEAASRAQPAVAACA